MKTIKDVIREGKWTTASQPIAPKEILCSPDCKECGGIGFIRYDVPVDHEFFGKLIPCSNLPPDSTVFNGHGLIVKELQTLAWNKIKDRENVSEAIKQLKKYLKRGRGVGYLYGGPGLAKTALLKILCAEWVRSGKGIFHFVTQKEIIDDLRVAFDDDEPQRAIRDKQRMYEKFSLLAIDEVTVERSTDFKVEEFFHLINKRHEAGTELERPFLTVMAGNVPPKQLDYRIMDRLTDQRNFVVKLTGDSYRPAMKDVSPSQPEAFIDPRTNEILER